MSCFSFTFSILSASVVFLSNLIYISLHIKDMLLITLNHPHSWYTSIMSILNDYLECLHLDCFKIREDGQTFQFHLISVSRTDNRLTFQLFFNKHVISNDIQHLTLSFTCSW